jgi:4-hydroxy-tetrahydrodipicolinate synthase
LSGPHVTANSTTAGLQGVNVAAITPRGPAGDVNFGATFDLIDYLCAARVGGIALFTAWGEYPSLAVEDRARLTYLAVKRSRVPVLVGVGSATLDHSLALAREARTAGAAAILVPPPLFYRYDEDDIHEFYTQFASQMGGGLAILLSGEIAAETARRLLDTGDFAGIEDGVGTVQSVDGLGEHGGATVLIGHDSLFVRARSAGLGVVSAAACAVPELSMALDRAIAAGDGERIACLDAMFQELLGWLDRFPQPVGLKTAVAVRGIQTGPLAVPLPPRKQICLEQFREWFKGWLHASKKLTAHA